jgi:CHASE2 domain-containing sensor protein
MISKRLVFKALIYLCIYHALSFILSTIMEKRFMQFLSIQHVVTSDFTYNDLFYRVQYKSEKDNQVRKHKEEILIVNTARLQGQNFRSDLAQVIERVQEYQPKAVGVDITFRNRWDRGNKSLFKALSAHKNIICAFEASNKKHSKLLLPPEIKMGDVDFPKNQHSIRFYKGGDKTMAYQLFKMARGKNSKNQVSSVKSFPISFTSIHDGVVGLDDVFSDNYDKNYKVIDARSLMEEEYAAQHYGPVLKGSIVIIGHTGGYFDVEDKHAVPTDTTRLVNRKLIMPGAAIHANTLSNLLDDRIFHEPNTLLVNIILNLVMFLMILLILRHPMKLFLLSGLAVFSIVWIWIAMYLMELNIYIQVGVTLLELMILEEFIETFDPFVMRLWNRIRNKKEKNSPTV